MTYEAVTDSSWDLWVWDVKAGKAERLTSLPGNERSSAWSADSLWVYFRKDERSVWRIPVGSSGGASGPPKPWMELMSPREFPSDSIDISASGSDVLLALGERASDLWLIERSGPTGAAAKK